MSPTSSLLIELSQTQARVLIEIHGGEQCFSQDVRQQEHKGVNFGGIYLEWFPNKGIEHVSL